MSADSSLQLIGDKKRKKLILIAVSFVKNINDLKI